MPFNERANELKVAIMKSVALLCFDFKKETGMMPDDIRVIVSEPDTFSEHRKIIYDVKLRFDI